MIIGNGLIANALKDSDREHTVFIAAGVSDSTAIGKWEFEREADLVKRTIADHGDKLIVFFSTFSINDPAMKENLYVKNKLRLEKYIREMCSKFLIVRVSNLVGPGGNKRNIFNYLFDHIVNGEHFTLWKNAKRNLITVNDFVTVLNHILDKEFCENPNTTVNIINVVSFSINEIVETIESATGYKAVYDLSDIESQPQYTDDKARLRMQRLNIDTRDYLNKILNSYFLTSNKVSSKD